MKLWRLEAVRGAAASYVTVGHMFPSVPVLFSFGQEAVMVFFLLSGFVIEYSASPKLSRGFSYYFSKRFLRIYSVLLCMFGIACLLTNTAVASPAFLRQLGGNLLMLQDFSTGKPHVIVAPLFSGALWSLHYEWWFYMLYFPAVTRIPARIQVHVVGVVGILAALTYVVWPYDPNRLLLYFPIWWAGVAMARAYVCTGAVTSNSVRAPCFYLACIGLVLLGSCMLWLRQGKHLSLGLHPFLELRHILATFLAIGIALTWQKAGWKYFRTLLGWGCMVAPISYALYIAHEPLLVDSSYLDGRVPSCLRIPAYVTILILFCCVTELWLYRWLNRRFESASRKVSPAPSA